MRLQDGCAQRGAGRWSWRAGVQARGEPQAARRHQEGFPMRASLREAGCKLEAMHPCCVPTGPPFEWSNGIGQLYSGPKFKSPLFKALETSVLFSKCAPAQSLQSCSTLETVACQAPLSTGFSGREYWSVSPRPPAGAFPAQGANTRLLHCRQSLYCWAIREAL